MKLTKETKVKSNYSLPARLRGCDTVGELQAKLTKRETVAAYRYSQGWQVEIRSTTNAGRMKRVACFEIV